MIQWRPVPKIFSQKIPNQPLTLYQGSAELLQIDVAVSGKVRINFTWHPFPRITLNFVHYGEEDIELKAESKLEINPSNITPQHQLNVHLTEKTSWPASQKNEYTGYLLEPLLQGSIENSRSATFHVTNFYHFNISNLHEWNRDDDQLEIKEGWVSFDGQFIFEYENWHIVLATLDNCFELTESLRENGGYGVTHICKINKLDDDQLNPQEIQETIEAFCYFLSFSRGLWLAPILVSGFDFEGNQIFEEWRTPTIRSDAWEHDYSWSSSDSTEIVEVFPGFMEKWNNPDWKEVVQNSIQWYIESLKVTTESNTCIILLQAALEKLAWTFLNTNSCLSSDGFKRLTVADQIRLLLKFLDIPLYPLKEFGSLSKLAKELGCKDIVQTISSIRNSVIHPIFKKSKTYEDNYEAALAEARQVFLLYLEIVLLKLFKYPYSLSS